MLCIFKYIYITLRFGFCSAGNLPLGGAIILTYHKCDASGLLSFTEELLKWSGVYFTFQWCIAWHTAPQVLWLQVCPFLPLLFLFSSYPPSFCKAGIVPVSFSESKCAACHKSYNLHDTWSPNSVCQFLAVSSGAHTAWATVKSNISIQFIWLSQTAKLIFGREIQCRHAECFMKGTELQSNGLWCRGCEVYRPDRQAALLLTWILYTCMQTPSYRNTKGFLKVSYRTFRSWSFSGISFPWYGKQHQDHYSWLQNFGPALVCGLLFLKTIHHLPGVLKLMAGDGRFPECFQPCTKKIYVFCLVSVRVLPYALGFVWGRR